MPGRIMRHPLALLFLFVAVGTVVSGCTTAGTTFRSDMTWQRFGIRPDEPKLGVPANQSTCQEYMQYAAYAQRLMEAYHSRASQNRGWIYIAGITGLGVAAASGGLAAAATVGAGTLALLSLSGGFAAGTFATINNEELAHSYTIAVNRVDRALNSADAMLPPAARFGSPDACGQALAHLKNGVLVARTKLEDARTHNALGALDRATEQQKKIVAMAHEIVAQQAAVVTASPAALTIDQTKDQTSTVTLNGGKPPYRVVDKPTNVTAALVSGKIDAYTVVVKKDAEEGNIVFLDDADPPATLIISVKKAPVVADPPTITIDTSNAQTKTVTLTGGKPPYKVTVKPANVTVTPDSPTTSPGPFTVVVPGNAAVGNIVFEDSSQPTLSVSVSVQK